jgi:ketosteroid isomerase-like protein
VTFRETLDKHLRAIQDRDLTALAAALPADELTLITSDGRLVGPVAEFLARHRGWFAMTNWTLGWTAVRTEETAEMGFAVLELDYRETPPDRPPLRQRSYLTLVFRRQDGGWVMVLDQNTPSGSRQGAS